MTLLLLVVGCDSDTVPSSAASRSPAELTLPACGKPPSPDPDPPPPGAVMPPKSRVTAVRPGTPLTQLNGYVELTPREVREWVDAQPDLEVLAASDEPNGSHLLVTDGNRRTFIKVLAVCADASLLSEVVADEASANMLPTPGGSRPP